MIEILQLDIAVLLTRKKNIFLIFSTELKTYHLFTDAPNSCPEKTLTINSWKRHAFWDSVFVYVKNRWKFKHAIKNIMGTKYVRFKIINISKYGHFTRWIDKRDVSKFYWIKV